jgi:pyrimidine operon attenuation protein/uracil phosphoribosyltransferase
VEAERPDTVVIDSERMDAALTRIAHEVSEQNQNGEVALVGIHTRGAILAARLAERIADISQRPIAVGDVDIALYRDDLATRAAAPVVHSTHLDFDVAGKTVVVVDDVLYTGRTVRAAIDVIFDFGRPEAIRLAVLCDRGHRELPIRPDFVGKNIPTSRGDHVAVKVLELDGVDCVTLSNRAVR